MPKYLLESPGAYLLENVGSYLLEDDPSSAVSFVSAISATNGAASATSVSCAMPSGYAAGDLLVAVHGIGSKVDTPSFSTGWNVHSRVNDIVGVGDTLLWKIAVASEPSLVATTSGTRNHGLIIAAYRNPADTVAPFAAVAGVSQASLATHTAPGATIADNIFEVTFAFDHRGSDLAGTTGWTVPLEIIRRASVIRNAVNSNSGTSCTLGDRGFVTSTGSVPTRDWISTVADDGSAWSVAIKSA